MVNKSIEIVLIGTGFYVCGGKKNEYGTILPAIFSFAKLNQINVEIVIAINNKIVLKTFRINLII